jgi:urease accessory protein
LYASGDAFSEMIGGVAGPLPRSNPMAAVRSRGEIDLAFRHDIRRTAAFRSYQAGCLRLRLPRRHADERPEAVLINTSGGIADGDRLAQRVAWGEATAATVASQAAEKVYRATGDGSAIATRLEVEAGADAEWLPQETILFDRARLRRDMQVRMAESAQFLGVEAIVLGRTAMGEQMREGLLDDRWRVWRGGRLVFADALRLAGPVESLMRRRALGAGTRAMAMIVHISSRAAALLGPVREALGGAVGMAAASAWNGILLVRLLAKDGAVLRHDLLLALGALRGGRAMPRVWSC